MSADSDGVFDELFRLTRLVASETACSLPGVSIKFDSFIPVMWRAVTRGFVEPHLAEFVQNGLRWGFDAGVQRSLLHGQRVFRNYPTALGEFRERVSESIETRVAAGKTLDLGVWADTLRPLLRAVFGDYFIFPLGAVPKPLEPKSCRPYSDHTKTGLNAATWMGLLTHTLRTHEEIAWFLKHGFAMHVSDVDNAFPMLPLAPWLWPFFMSRFFRAGSSDLSLFAHVCADFGTRGLPGTFKIFFVDVLVNMARSELLLTLPFPIYVDDGALIAPLAKAAVREMHVFQEWAEDKMGFRFKRLKDRPAAHVQYCLGFWFDSFLRTRTLDEHKLLAYCGMLIDFSTRRVLTLLERQQIAGRMQRAVLTMPPGAGCLLANMFCLFAGLVLPWHRRRTTAAERRNYRFFHDVLQLNLGRGYFSFDRFKQAPETCSDASKQRRYSGGGWVSKCGAYDWWRYGTKAARKLIDYLEGDTVVSALESMGARWNGCWVPFGVDNQSFQRSAVKGWSHAERLTLLLKRVFVLQIRYNCLCRFFWLSSEDNLLADHLSREDGLERFLRDVYATGYWSADVVPSPELDAGRVRGLDTSVPFSSEDFAYMRERAMELERSQADSMGDTYAMQSYSLRVSAAVVLQALVRGWLARRATYRVMRVQGARPRVLRGHPIGGGLVRFMLFSLFLCCAGAVVREDGATTVGISHGRVPVHTCPHVSMPVRAGVSAGASSMSEFCIDWCWDACCNAQPTESDSGRLCFADCYALCLALTSIVPPPEAVWRLAFGTLAVLMSLVALVPVSRFVLWRCWGMGGGGRGEGRDLVTPRTVINHLDADGEAAAPRRRVRRGHPAAARILRFTHVLALLGGVGAVGHGGAGRQESSIIYSRTDLFTGLPEALLSRLDSVLDNRLAASSMRTVNAGYGRWVAVAEEYGWDHIMVTDDSHRGAKLVAFVLTMLRDTSLVFDSINSYVWGCRSMMKLQHQADPVMGVQGWTDFMAAVKVLSFVPHEPRREIPVELIQAMLEAVDLTSFSEVNFALFIVILFFTFSRSECPCPKHFTGESSWDPQQHWMVRDIAIQAVSGAYALAVRFKAIKQDPRIERANARGDGTERGASRKGGADWSYVGKVPGSIFCPFLWYRRFMSFFSAARCATDPFFLARDQRRPYTYTAAMADLKMFLARVGSDTDFGIHGLRVAGYNASKSAVGLELTVAHGGWESSAHSRYERFPLRTVFSMAASMVGGTDVYRDAPAEVRNLVRTQGLARSTAAAQAAASTDGAGASTDGAADLPLDPLELAQAQNAQAVVDAQNAQPPGLLPPGWSMEAIISDEGEELVTFAPPADMHTAASQTTLEGAWRVHREATRLAASSSGSLAAAPQELSRTRSSTRGSPRA